MWLKLTMLLLGSTSSPLAFSTIVGLVDARRDGSEFESRLQDSFVHFPELGTTAKLPQAKAAELRRSKVEYKRESSKLALPPGRSFKSNLACLANRFGAASWCEVLWSSFNQVWQWRHLWPCSSEIRGSCSAVFGKKQMSG